MSTLLKSVMVVGIALQSVAASQDPQSPLPDSATGTELQGEWQPIDVQMNGKPVSAVAALKGSRWIFRGDESIHLSLGDFAARDVRGESKETFRLDPSKSPKQIDVVVTFADPKHKPVTRLGIYSLEGERLTICTSATGGRPSSFHTSEGDGNTLTVLRRIGPDALVRLEFAKIQDDFSRAHWARFEALQNAKTPAERRRIDAEIGPKPDLFAERYLKFAESHPDEFLALVALCRAAFHAPASEPGTKAIAMLKSGRLKQTDLSDLNLALTSSHIAIGPGQKSLAPLVLAAVKEHLDHPDAARLLTWICTTQAAPAAFESADLIVDHFADSPDIVNFCEIVGAGGSTVFARKFEGYLRVILDKNTHRMVRSRALFGLAAIVQRAGEARQHEAEQLYHQFIAEFEDPPKDNGDTIEQMLLTQAQAELEEIGARGLGKPAPDLSGDDLDGRPMKLSDFRGKVVLISFWATWCGPCMRMVPHEKLLVERLRDKPFVLVGVNGDIEPADLKAGIDKHGITWRSFKNAQSAEKVISEEWKVPGWPTMYLVDRQGIIRKRWTEMVALEVLDSEVDKLIEMSDD